MFLIVYMIKASFKNRVRTKTISPSKRHLPEISKCDNRVQNENGVTSKLNFRNQIRNEKFSSIHAFITPHKIQRISSSVKGGRHGNRISTLFS